MRALYLASSSEANDFLAASPLALLLGMMLDQQIPMEKAFSSPYVLAQRLAARSSGGPTPAGRELSAAEIAALDEDELVALFSTPPALHRFPAAMAKRAQTLCQIVVERYDGDAAAIWTTATTGDDLVRRLTELPGLGPVKARMFAALLGKQFGARPRGWRESSEPYGQAGTFVSVADVVDADSLGKVKAYKKQSKAAARAAKG